MSRERYQERCPTYNRYAVALACHVSKIALVQAVGNDLSVRDQCNPKPQSKNHTVHSNEQDELSGR